MFTINYSCQSINGYSKKRDYIGGVITDREDLTLQTPESFKARFNIDVRVLNEAVKISPDTKTVTVKNLRTGETYEETYDNLILSMGAEPIRPNIEGADGSNVFTLRNIPDTLKIKNYIDTAKPRSAVVIGGGYIGVEMAENLAEAGLKVAIVELADHLIAPLDFDMAADVHRIFMPWAMRSRWRISSQRSLPLFLLQGLLISRAELPPTISRDTRAFTQARKALRCLSSLI